MVLPRRKIDVILFFSWSFVNNKIQTGLNLGSNQFVSLILLTKADILLVRSNSNQISDFLLGFLLILVLCYFCLQNSFLFLL